MDNSLLSFLIQGAALGVSAALSPGPFQSLVIAESLAGGFRRGAPVTFAPLIADIPIAGVLVFAISQVPAQFLDGVRIAGALLLLYLAWGIFRTLRAPHSQDKVASPPPASVGRGLFLGVLMLFLSPGPYLFWSLVNGPILLRGLSIGLSHAIAFLTSFYFFSIGGLLIISYLLSRVGGISPAWRRGLQAGSLLLLVAVAAFLLSQVLTA